MMFPIMILAGLMVLTAQLMLCCWCAKRWVRWIPLGCFVFGELACGCVLLAENWLILPYGAAFGAYIYGMILVLFLGMDILAWCLYGIGIGIRRRLLRRAGR